MYDRDEQAAIERFEDLLEVYDFETLLENNGLTIAEALFLLAQAGHIEYPEVHPV